MSEAAEVRAITIFPPMSWALVAGYKTVENRYGNTEYRGPLAIHAGAEIKQRWMEYDSIRGAMTAHRTSHGGLDPELSKRAIVGVCRLVGAHPATGECCKPWGLSNGWHWELADAVELRRPISMRGQQGLWTVPADTAAFLLEQLG